MYLVRLAALILAGMLVSACAATTFESLHYGEGGRPENSGGLTQSYYVPKTLLSVEIKRAGGERIIQLAKESVPERAAHFKVHYNHSSMHNDDLVIETTPKGYLKQVKAHSKDETAAIVESLAKIIMTNIGGVPRTSIRGFAPGGMRPETVLTVQFDPFDPEDFEYMNKLMHRQGYCLAVFDRNDDLVPGSCYYRVAKERDAPRRGQPIAIALPEEASGFFYRKPIHHKLIVFERKKHRWRPVWAGWEAFENQAELLRIKVDRGAFITSEAQLDFDNGVLVKYSMKKPSEVLGFMSIPSVVVSTIVQIPGLQVGQAERQNDLREREIAAREKTNQLRERELQLRRVGVNQSGQPIYLPPDPARSVSVAARARRLDPERKQFEEDAFMESCRDRLGVPEQDCRREWRRRMGANG